MKISKEELEKRAADLQEHMKNCPGKTRVWVNESGEWSNHKDAKYPIELTREYILSGGKKDVSKVKDLNTKTKDAGPQDNGDAGNGSEDNGSKDTKNTTDPKIAVKVTKENKKDAPPGAKIGDTFEIDNPDYEDPALK